MTTSCSQWFCCPVIEEPNSVHFMDRWDVGDDLLIVDHTPKLAWADLAAERGWRYLPIGVNLGTNGAWNLARAIHCEERRPQDLLTFISCSVNFTVGLREVSNRIRFRSSWKGVQALGLGWHCMTFSRMFLEEIGTFDENLHPGYWGDNDYCYRAVVAGHMLAGQDSFPEVDLDCVDPPYGKALRSGALRYFSMRHQGAYYRAKWGGDANSPTTPESFVTPFNLPVPLGWWSPAYRPILWEDGTRGWLPDPERNPE